MARSSPPSNVIFLRPCSSKILSVDDLRSPPLSETMEFFDQLHQQGIVLAPAMPEPEALAMAAQKAGITPIEALVVYLTILNYE